MERQKIDVMYAKRRFTQITGFPASLAYYFLCVYLIFKGSIPLISMFGFANTRTQARLGMHFKVTANILAQEPQTEASKTFEGFADSSKKFQMM